MERLVTYLRCSGHLSWSHVIEAALGLSHRAEVATWVSLSRGSFRPTSVMVQVSGERGHTQGTDVESKW